MNVATHTAPVPGRITSGIFPSAWSERAALLLGVLTVVRLIVAARTGLSDTEAYYAGWSRFPSLSYYDHPPLVAWTTWLVRRCSTDAWAVRIGPVLCSAAFGALLYRVGARLFSPRAGFFAVVLVAAIPVFEFVGFLLNPEALLAPLWMLFILSLDDLKTNDEPWRPFVTGALIGVAFLAKYTALLGVPVALLYVAGSPSTRRWLSRPTFYVSGAIALAIATPVLLWNSAHGWPTLHLHLEERMVRPSTEGLGQAFARVGAGQLALFHPVALPAFVALLVYAVARARRDERYRLLATASLPVLAFLLVMMVRAADSEPHWTMMGYAPLAVVAGGVLDESTGRLRRFAEWTLQATLFASAAAVGAYAVHLASPALMDAFPSYNPNADPSTETIGWDRIRDTVASHAAALGPGTVVAAAHNVLCGHVQAAIDDSPPVYCPSPRRTQFDFEGRKSPPVGVPVVFVDSDRYPADIAQALPHHRCVDAQDVELQRGGHVLGRYRIHECRPEGGG
jgi:4-amino-4-deoxy-L-arabinose transferase-like glycosyltransferase